jgi:hypothetical protein
MEKFSHAAWLRRAEAAGSKDGLLERTSKTLEFEYNETLRMSRGGVFPTFVVEQFGEAAEDAMRHPEKFVPFAQRVLREQLEEWQDLFLAEREKMTDEEIGELEEGDDVDEALAATVAQQRKSEGKLRTTVVDPNAAANAQRVVQNSADIFLDQNNANRVMHLPIDQFRAVLPEGVPKDITELWELPGGQARFLVRQTTIDLITSLKALAANSFMPFNSSPVQPAVRADGSIDPEITPGVKPVAARDPLGNALRDEPADVRSDRLVRELGAYTPTFYIDGDTGSGKTMTLLQTALWARTSGWIVLYVKDADALLNGGSMATPSTIFPGLYDENDVAHDILKPFLAAHKADLANRYCQTTTSTHAIALIKEKAASGPDEVDTDAALAAAQAAAAAAAAAAQSKKGKKGAAAAAAPAAPTRSAVSEIAKNENGRVTLLQLVEAGVERNAVAAAVIAALAAELACIVDVPVMVALDNVNALAKPSHMYFEPSLLKMPGMKPARSRKDTNWNDFDSVRNAPALAAALGRTGHGALKANLRKNQLTVARALGGLEAQGLANGVVVGALSSRHNKYFLNEDSRDSRAVVVERYSTEELEAILQDYVATGVALAQLTPFETDYVGAMTARRPREVLKFAQLI